MEGLFWSANKLAGLIASHEDIKKEKRALIILHRYVKSTLRESGGYGPFQALLIQRPTPDQRYHDPRPWDTKIMQQYLWAGADINERNPSGHTFLHIATMNEHPDLSKIIQIGMGFGAHLDIPTRDRRTVLDIWMSTEYKPELGWDETIYQLTRQPRRLECIAASALTQTW
jgi:hypothetical protein